MHFNFLFLFLCLNFMCASAFFLWKLKKEPLFFCYKVCPLYCSKSSKNRRSDLDYSASSFIEDELPGPPEYWEDPNDYHSHDHHSHDHHTHDHYHEHLYPTHDHHYEPHEYEIIKTLKFIYHPIPPTTTTTTTKKPETTTEAPSGICIACMKKCYHWPLEDPWY